MLEGLAAGSQRMNHICIVLHTFHSVTNGLNTSARLQANNKQGGVGGARALYNGRLVLEGKNLSGSLKLGAGYIPHPTSGE